MLALEIRAHLRVPNCFAYVENNVSGCGFKLNSYSTVGYTFRPRIGPVDVTLHYAVKLSSHVYVAPAVLSLVLRGYIVHCQASTMSVQAYTDGSAPYFYRPGPPDEVRFLVACTRERSITLLVEM